MTITSSVQHERQESSATLLNLNFGFYQCPDAVLEAKGLSWRAKCIYSRLLYYARRRETCFPGHARLAADLGKSVDTIQRGLCELRSFGLITWKRRGLTKTNLYTIVKLTDIPAFKNDVLSKPQPCPDKKEQECGNLKPHKCGTNQSKPNHSQLESDEAFSKAQKRMDESATPTSRHRAHGTLRNPEDKMEKASTVSNQNSGAPSHTDPSPLASRGESLKPESSRLKETGRQLKGLKRIDEIIQGSEQPRLAGPPLTQEDMDKRIRERLSRERERTQNPLPGIIPDGHWTELQGKNPTQRSSCKSRRQPVDEKLQLALEHISEELGDWKHVLSNITQAENIRRQADMEIDVFIETIFEARYATKYAVTTGKVIKRDASGKLLKMPYFFAVLRQKVGLTKEKAS